MLLNLVKRFFVYQNTSSSIYFTAMTGSTSSAPIFTSCWDTLCSKTVAGAIKSFSAGYSGMDIGFGNTPETESDYKLADGNLDNPQLTRIASGKNSLINGIIHSQYLNVRNDTANNIVVKEIGIYANPTNAASSNGNNTGLLFRKVLDTPVTIAPGEIYSFTYTVRFKNS